MSDYEDDEIQEMPGDDHDEQHDRDADEQSERIDERPEFIDPEPWPEPVGSDAIMMEIILLLQRYTVMDEKEQLAVTLWILNAHCHELARHSPFLAFQSPTMRCGKSTALNVVESLTPRPMAMSHVTGASLYRMIHDHAPTVLIDELDQVIHRNKDLRAVLNTAHNRQTAFVPRVVKGSVVRFRVFSPKAMACIGKLPDTLQDRSIIINLRRKRPDEVVEQLPIDSVAAHADVTRRIARWVMDNRHLIGSQRPILPTGLNDRAGDNWRPLLAIADVLGPKWAAMGRLSAMEVSRASDEESVDPAEQLIRDIGRVFNSTHGVKQLPVDRLHAALVEMDGSMWTEFDRGQPLSKARLGRMLIPFGIRSAVVRLRGKVTRVYLRSAFEDAFSRYCRPAAAA